MWKFQGFEASMDAQALKVCGVLNLSNQLVIPQSQKYEFYISPKFSMTFMIELGLDFLIKQYD